MPINIYYRSHLQLIFVDTFSKVLEKIKDNHSVLIRGININVDFEINNNYLNVLSENGFTSFININNRFSKAGS